MAMEEYTSRTVVFPSALPRSPPSAQHHSPSPFASTLSTLSSDMSLQEEDLGNMREELAETHIKKFKVEGLRVHSETPSQMLVKAWSGSDVKTTKWTKQKFITNILESKMSIDWARVLEWVNSPNVKNPPIRPPSQDIVYREWAVDRAMYGCITDGLGHPPTSQLRPSGNSLAGGGDADASEVDDWDSVLDGPDVDRHADDDDPDAEGSDVPGDQDAHGLVGGDNLEDAQSGDGSLWGGDVAGPALQASPAGSAMSLADVDMPSHHHHGDSASHRGVNAGAPDNQRSAQSNHAASVETSDHVAHDAEQEALAREAVLRQTWKALRACKFLDKSFRPDEGDDDSSSSEAGSSDVDPEDLDDLPEDDPLRDYKQYLAARPAAVDQRGWLAEDPDERWPGNGWLHGRGAVLASGLDFRGGTPDGPGKRVTVILPDIWMQYFGRTREFTARSTDLAQAFAKCPLLIEGNVYLTVPIDVGGQRSTIGLAAYDGAGGIHMDDKPFNIQLTLLDENHRTSVFRVTFFKFDFELHGAFGVIPAKRPRTRSMEMSVPQEAPWFRVPIFPPGAYPPRHAGEVTGDRQVGHPGQMHPGIYGAPPPLAGQSAPSDVSMAAPSDRSNDNRRFESAVPPPTSIAPTESTSAADPGPVPADAAGPPHRIHANPAVAGRGRGAQGVRQPANTTTTKLHAHRGQAGGGPAGAVGQITARMLDNIGRHSGTDNAVAGPSRQPHRIASPSDFPPGHFTHSADEGEGLPPVRHGKGKAKQSERRAPANPAPQAGPSNVAVSREDPRGAGRGAVLSEEQKQIQRQLVAWLKTTVWHKSKVVVQIREAADDTSDKGAREVSRLVQWCSVVDSIMQMASPLGDAPRVQVSSIVVGKFLNHGDDWVQNCCKCQRIIATRKSDPRVDDYLKKNATKAMGINKLLSRLQGVTGVAA
ncbi:hypothetical protein OH76DRAFT_1415427 [Lentinus brumalis]|uniref:Uncharacterized protein n=1 Tax=Lentinus brumalis TaxID=2498619 RepID=A0A371DQ82_9APHY|nr:hypothetical protein OH76DRAFT_1415427 [Polyporus brumalis]